jgi:NitT/TauT family transport system substrate-binding protein
LTVAARRAILSALGTVRAYRPREGDVRSLTLAAFVCWLLVACAPAAAPPQPAPAPAAAQAAAPSASAAPPQPPAAAAPPPRERIKVSFASDTAVYAPFFVALDKGYLAEEGIEVEAVQAGGGAATPALISGDLNYSTSAATSVSAILKGAPLKVIFTNADRPMDELWAITPDVATLADLAGKTVGVQSRGDTMEIETRLVLMQHGLDPNAVGYSAVGVGGQRLAALQAGAVAAAILTAAEAVELRDALPQGRLLANVREEVQMLYMGVATTDAELEGHRDRAKRYLRAVVKGREYAKAFRDETIDVLGQHNQAARKANEIDYDLTLPALTEDGSIAPEIQRRDTALRAEINGLEQYPGPDQIYDYSLVQEIYAELRASGWRPTR